MPDHVIDEVEYGIIAENIGLVEYGYVGLALPQVGQSVIRLMYQAPVPDLYWSSYWGLGILLWVGSVHVIVTLAQLLLGVAVIEGIVDIVAPSGGVKLTVFQLLATFPESYERNLYCIVVVESPGITLSPDHV